MVLLWISTGCSSQDAGSTESEKETDVEQVIEEENLKGKNESEVSESAEPGEEKSTMEEEWDVSQLQVIQGFSDMVDHFSVLSYSFGVSGETTIITMEWMGEEQINGKQTDHVKMNMKDSGEPGENIELWINQDGEAEQLISNGEKMENELVKAPGQSYVMMLLMPFNFMESRDVTSILMEEQSFPNVDVTKKGEGRKKIGDVEVETYTYDVETEGEPSTWEVGNFGNFQLLTSWTVQTDGVESTFEVLDLKLRD